MIPLPPLYLKLAPPLAKALLLHAVANVLVAVVLLAYAAKNWFIEGSLTGGLVLLAMAAVSVLAAKASTNTAHGLRRDVERGYRS